jgi:endonuclease III
MKNASKYADILKGLLRTFHKEGKPPPHVRMDPTKALVRGAMSYGVSDGRADEAMAAIEREFVNLNELRVGTDLEIQEMLGSKYPDIAQRAEMITRNLNAIFEREHTLSLDRLKTISRKDARQFLRDLPAMNAFVEAYIMLFGFEGANGVPLDQEMFNCLREHGMFEEKTPLEDAQRFLENHLKGEECYDFYALLRRAAYRENKKKVKA